MTEGFLGENEPYPSPQTDRLYHTWSVDLYTYSIIICTAILVPLNAYVFVKVYQGSGYPFILFLLVLFIVSSLSECISAILMH